MDLPKPVPSDDEVLIEVKSSSVNPLDYKLCEGELKFYSGFRFPQIYGSDVCGVVVECGKKVFRLKVGDEVFGMTSRSSFGAFAEYTLSKERNLSLAPVGVGKELLGVLPLAGLTAVQSLRMANLSPGSRVLIIGGSGGVGHFAVQLAQIYGYETHAICSSMNKEFVKSLGADKVYAYDLKEHVVLDQKFDLIFDVVNSHKFSEVKERLNPNGSYINTIPSMNLISSMLLSYFGTGPTAKLIIVKPSSGDLNELASLMSAQEIHSHVSKVFGLADLKDALRLIKSGRTVGKIAINVD